jgi:glycosyltransferase involved in cell wall biosynthesis
VRLPTMQSKHLETLIHTLLSTIHACFSQYDIVHYHTLGPSLFSFLPRLFGKKTIVTVQGLDWQRKKWGWFAKRILKLAEWASAKLPDKTIVVSRVLQSYYGSRYSRQPIYIPNGTQPRERQNRGHLAMLGLAPSSYVLFLGGFSPEKNCHLLIEAFERTSTALKLVFAGGSSYTDDYVASLRRHESGRIMFLNWLSGDILADVITNAGLFVLPSDMEGMSLALLDAMGAGLCVLASDTPENCEVIQDVGFTFRRADVVDLQRMLELLLSEPELRDSTGIRAQTRVRQHYLWENVTQEIATIYSEMMQPHSEKTMAHGA